MSTTAEYMRQRRAKLRALRPLPATVDRAAIAALEISRQSCRLSVAEMSAVVGKSREWWRHVAKGGRLLETDHALLVAHLRSLVLKAGKNAP